LEKVLILTIALLVVFSITGCNDSLSSANKNSGLDKSAMSTESGNVNSSNEANASQNDTTNSSEASANNSTINNAEAVRSVRSEMNMNAELGLPQNQPDLVGKVKDIVGNEVTVYKAEMEPNPNQSRLEEGKSPPENTDNRVPKDRGLTVGDEIETFIIPVGTPIISLQRGTDGMEAVEVEITEIKSDNILRVWKNEDEVTFVQLMNNNRAGNGAANEGRTQGMPPEGMMGPPPRM